MVLAQEFAMDPTHENLPHSSDMIVHSLGEAVVHAWSRLPHDVQQMLFEKAVTACGETLRPQLAVFLHERHPRTSTALKSRAMVEPDSLGG
jgi:hypothetical protein